MVSEPFTGEQKSAVRTSAFGRTSAFAVGSLSGVHQSKARSLAASVWPKPSPKPPSGPVSPASEGASARPTPPAQAAFAGAPGSAPAPAAGGQSVEKKNNEAPWLGSPWKKAFLDGLAWGWKPDVCQTEPLGFPQRGSFGSAGRFGVVSPLNATTKNPLEKLNFTVLGNRNENPPPTCRCFDQEITIMDQKLFLICSKSRRVHPQYSQSLD